MAALTHLCDFPSIPGFKFQPIDDCSTENEYCKYYSCWDGKVLFISLTSDNINLKNKTISSLPKNNNLKYKKRLIKINHVPLIKQINKCYPNLSKDLNYKIISSLIIISILIYLSNNVFEININEILSSLIISFSTSLLFSLFISFISTTFITNKFLNSKIDKLY